MTSLPPRPFQTTVSTIPVNFPLNVRIPIGHLARLTDITSPVQCLCYLLSRFYPIYFFRCPFPSDAVHGVARSASFWTRVAPRSRWINTAVCFNTQSYGLISYLELHVPGFRLLSWSLQPNSRNGTLQIFHSRSLRLRFSRG